MKAGRRSLTGILAAFFILAGSAALHAETSRDTFLKLKAQDRLYHAKLAEMVRVEVEDGRATLEGVVQSAGQRKKAEKKVSDVDGITAVVNRLSVDYPGITDAGIVEEAASRIRRYSYYTIFDNVRLSAQDGRLVLEGSVRHPWRSADLERLVETIEGVREVENRLDVLPVSPMDDRIRLRVARAIYGDPLFARYRNRANPPIHIVVKNGDVTLSGVVHTEVERLAAERAARFAATFFGLSNDLEVESKRSGD